MSEPPPPAPPSEDGVIRAHPDRPVTVPSLVRDLRALGVRPGGVLLVHTSLSSLGWVCGGAQAVVLALEEAVGPDGTLVMPAFSGHLSDPARWGNPPVPEAWWDAIRATMPSFDPHRTPTRGIGAVAESFRAGPRVVRSPHPSASFAAQGPRATAICSTHPVDFDLGDTSPLGRLYAEGADVLLLGVGHIRNTSLHLAEFRARWDGRVVETKRVPAPGGPFATWVDAQDVVARDRLFPRIGAAFDVEAGVTRFGKVGAADARLFPQRELVDFAVRWFESGRAG